MEYKYLILKMVLAMSNEEYVFKIYHYILANTAKRNTRQSMKENRNAKPRLSALCPNWKALILSKVYTALSWVCYQ